MARLHDLSQSLTDTFIDLISCTRPKSIFLADPLKTLRVQGSSFEVEALFRFLCFGCGVRGWPCKPEILLPKP